jgi:hypothetical protein
MPRLILEVAPAFGPPHDEGTSPYVTVVSVTRDNGQPLDAENVQWTIKNLVKASGDDVTITGAGPLSPGYSHMPFHAGPSHWQKGTYVLGLMAQWAEQTGVGPNNVPKLTFHHGQTIIRVTVT